jgi:hypothetical protein
MDALGTTFKIPLFEIFSKNLTKEQTKLMLLDVLYGSMNLAPGAQTSKGKYKT